MEEKNEETKELNLFERIINLYFSPSKTFQSLNRKPSWIYVFIIILIFSAAFQFVTKDVIIKDRINKIEMNERLDKEGKENAIEQTKNMYKPPMSYLMIIGMIVGILVYWLAASGALFLTGNVILGGETTFKKMFSVYVYSGLVSIPDIIIKTPLILSKESMNVQTNLALFMDYSKSDTFLFNFLTHIDIFAIWQVVLVALGFTVLYKFSLKKSLIVIAILQFIYALGSAGFSSVTGGIF